MKVALFLVLVLALSTANGFRVTLVRQIPTIAHSRISGTFLHSFHRLRATTEDDATYLMAKAQECGLSDNACKDDVKFFLRELLHVQSSCVVGTLSARSLCENQEEVAEIVQHLQAKLDEAERQQVLHGAVSVDSNGGAYLMPTAPPLALAALGVATAAAIVVTQI